jgi:organic hydroperoxide reductase OsmC/OhrA
MNVRAKPREHTYRARLRWTGGAHGATEAYAAYSREHRLDFEGKPSLAGSADATFRGDSSLHNPEDLLVAALCACHMLTYLALCARAGIAVTSYEDDATGTMVETNGVGKFSRVMLRPRVLISRGDSARATALHDDAHRDCFIAASVNFPVEHEPVVTAVGAHA